MARNTITTEDFVCRAISVHGAVYDYGRTLYSGTKNKIGITTQSIKQRFHWGYTAYNLDVIAEHHMSIHDAWVKEQHIINAFKDQRYVPTIKIGGYTECFTNRVDVKYIQSLM